MLCTAHCLKSGRLTGCGRSVWLAVPVVPWHNFNFVGFSWSISDYRPYAECSLAASFHRGFSQSKVRDETSPIRCGIAREARSPVERNHRKPSSPEGFLQTCSQATLRGDRDGRASCDRSNTGPSTILIYSHSPEYHSSRQENSPSSRRTQCGTPARATSAYPLRNTGGGSRAKASRDGDGRNVVTVQPDRRG